MLGMEGKILRFKEYLVEADLYASIKKTEKFNLTTGKTIKPSDFRERVGRNFGGERVTKLASIKGHDLYHVGYHPASKEPEQSDYVLHDPKTNKVHIHVRGKQHKRVLNIHQLSSTGEAPVKAHDFYHHILKSGHANALVGSGHSEGGQKVWQRLANKKSVSVHGWDYKKDVPVNIDAKDPDQTHASEKEVTAHKKDAIKLIPKHLRKLDFNNLKARSKALSKVEEKEPKERQDMALVASLKKE